MQNARSGINGENEGGKDVSCRVHAGQMTDGIFFPELRDDDLVKSHKNIITTAA